MFHMSLWSRVAGPLNVQHVLETDCNWQDNKAHNVKKGVCVCVCAFVLVPELVIEIIFLMKTTHRA